jgi:hypothetical protein
MRTSSLLAMAVAMAATYRAPTTLTRPYPTPTGPRGPGGKTERRAATKRAKQARKQQRGKK